MSESRQWTNEEVTKKFLDYFRSTAAYWETVEGKSKREALDGLAFSILSMLDGCSVGLPKFMVIPVPHESDKDYNVEQGENYYAPLKEVLEDICVFDLGDGGSLHERYYLREGIKNEERNIP